LDQSDLLVHLDLRDSRGNLGTQDPKDPADNLAHQGPLALLVPQETPGNLVPQDSKEIWANKEQQDQQEQLVSKDSAVQLDQMVQPDPLDP
jgi:hypothetical protein